VSSPEREILELKLRAELEPANVTALLDLGEACQRAGLDEAAKKAFERVLAIDPHNQTARRGRLRYFRRRYADASGDGYECAAIVHQVGELREPYAVPWLVALLEAADPVVCQKAAEALGRSGERAAVPALIRLLRNDAACAWWQAAEALGAIGDGAAVPPMLAVLAEGSPNARAAAAHALGFLRDPAATEGLAEALAQDDAAVRRAAARALGQLGDTAVVPTLATALDDPDPETRATAAESLGALVGKRFRASLLGSAERAAQRWWHKNGQFRHWGRRAPPHAALAARRRRQARDSRHALIFGGAAIALALLGLAGIAAFLALVLGHSGRASRPAPTPTAGAKP